MGMWADWVTADGRVHIGDDGYIYTLTRDGVTAELDPDFHQEDMDAYRRGEIDVVEYRRRYNVRSIRERRSGGQA